MLAGRYRVLGLAGHGGMGEVYEGVLALVVLIVTFGDRLEIPRFTPLDVPPEALAVKACEIAASLGYTRKPADRAYGFDYDTAYIRRQKTRDDWDKARHRMLAASSGAR